LRTAILELGLAGFVKGIVASFSARVAVRNLLRICNREQKIYDVGQHQNETKSLCSSSFRVSFVVCMCCREFASDIQLTTPAISDNKNTCSARTLPASASLGLPCWQCQAKAVDDAFQPHMNVKIRG
jgi:hypothetical protein